MGTLILSDTVTTINARYALLVGSMTKHVGTANADIQTGNDACREITQVWGSPVNWGNIPKSGPYPNLVSPTRARKPGPDLERRRRNFAAFVRRTLDAARLRGMTIAQMEEATGSGSTTWYGWRDERWTRDPVRDLVNRFCDGLGASRAEAYRALEWSDTPATRRRTAPEPITDDPTVRSLGRYLSDPKVSGAQKMQIRRIIAAIVADQGGSNEP